MFNGKTFRQTLHDDLHAPASQLMPQFHGLHRFTRFFVYVNTLYLAMYLVPAMKPTIGTAMWFLVAWSLFGSLFGFACSCVLGHAHTYGSAAIDNEALLLITAIALGVDLCFSWLPVQAFDGEILALYIIIYIVAAIHAYRKSRNQKGTSK